MLYGGFGGGVFVIHVGPIPGAPDDSSDMAVGGLTVSAGFGLRRNFTRVLGYQARGTLLAGMNDGPFFVVAADATLRLDPVADAFPFYFGVGPQLGLVAARHEDLGYVYANGSFNRVTRSGYGFLAGGVAEAGFVFGDNGTVDISARYSRRMAGIENWYRCAMLVLGLRLD